MEIRLTFPSIIDFLWCGFLLLFLPAISLSQWTKSDAADGPSVEVIARAGGELFAGFNVGVFDAQILVSSDDGVHWDSVDPGMPFTGILDLAAGGNLLIAGTYEDGALVSTDAGSTWTQVLDLPPGTGVFETAVSGTRLVGLTNLGVQSYLSADSGDTWIRIDTGSAPLEYGSNDFYTAGGGHLYAGTHRGLYRSTDNGYTWRRPANLGLYTQGDSTKLITTLIEHRGVIIGVQPNGISVTTDTGETWTNIPLSLGTNAYVSSFSAIGDTIFAGVKTGVQGSGWGVMMTLDSGDTWSPYNDGLPGGTSVMSLHESGGRLVLGTVGSGIWYRGLAADSGVTRTVTMKQGWNLISLPVLPADRSADMLFPGALSGAFRFDGGYAADSMLDNGTGYWIKFSAAGSIEVSGDDIATDTIDVLAGWNLLGAIGDPVPFHQVVRIPPAMVIQGPYFYDNGYIPGDTLHPGMGYWIKSDIPGKIVLHTTH